MRALLKTFAKLMAIFFVIIVMYLVTAITCKEFFDINLKEILNLFEYTMYLASLLAIEYLVVKKLDDE